jgi:hypothetical protein
MKNEYAQLIAEADYDLNDLLLTIHEQVLNFAFTGELKVLVDNTQSGKPIAVPAKYFEQTKDKNIVELLHLYQKVTPLIEKVRLYNPCSPNDEVSGNHEISLNPDDLSYEDLPMHVSLLLNGWGKDFFVTIFNLSEEGFYSNFLKQCYEKAQEMSFNIAAISDNGDENIRLFRKISACVEETKYNLLKVNGISPNPEFFA